MGGRAALRRAYSVDMPDLRARPSEGTARARPHLRRMTSGDRDVVGREEQVAALRAHLAEVAAGEGARLVLVHGARGGGVSTVVGAALDVSPTGAADSPGPEAPAGQTDRKSVV